MSGATTALVVGAGQLGSRHLQSLATLETLTHVDVVEPSEDARALTTARWADVAGSRGKALRFCSLDEATDAPAFVVIATTAGPRLSILDAVLRRGAKRILCEKVLFPTEADYRAALKLIVEAGADVRVNHIYRYALPFPELREQSRESGGSRFAVEVGGAGMGSNLIHFLDLASFLAHSTIERLTVDLDQPLVASKRGGPYKEFTGHCTARTRNGCDIAVRFSGSETRGPRIEFWAAGRVAVIDEATGRVDATRFEVADPAFASPRVSALTARIFLEMTEGTCPLPTVAESADANLHMLEQFNVAIHGRHDATTVCPVT